MSDSLLKSTSVESPSSFDDNCDKATAPGLAPYLHPVGNITAIHHDMQGSTNVADAERIGATDVSRLYQLTENGTLKAEYIYNDMVQRTKRTSIKQDGITVDTTAIYHYDRWEMLITETNEQGNLIKDYIWNEMHPVAQIDAVIPAQAGIQSIEAITYLYTDHLMTNRLATNQSKAIVWRWEGEAFGNTPAQELSGVSINLRFPGQYFDSETNLHYNMMRYYDPALGRYITSDPIGISGGMNTYLYANANPLIFLDIFGLDPGDRFDSRYEAAQDAWAYIIRKYSSDADIDMEYYTAFIEVLECPVRWIYTEPIPIGKYGGPSPPIQERQGGDFHSHGQRPFQTGHPGTFPSKADEKTARGRRERVKGYESYMGHREWIDGQIYDFVFPISNLEVF